MGDKVIVHIKTISINTIVSPWTNYSNVFLKMSLLRSYGREREALQDIDEEMLILVVGMQLIYFMTETSLLTGIQIIVPRDQQKKIPYPATKWWELVSATDDWADDVKWCTLQLGVGTSRVPISFFSFLLISLKKLTTSSNPILRAFPNICSVWFKSSGDSWWEGKKERVAPINSQWFKQITHTDSCV